jgi:hypothetical protein
MSKFKSIPNVKDQNITTPQKSIIAQCVMLNSFQHLHKNTEMRDPEPSSG